MIAREEREKKLTFRPRHFVIAMRGGGAGVNFRRPQHAVFSEILRILGPVVHRRVRVGDVAVPISL